MNAGGNLTSFLGPNEDIMYSFDGIGNNRVAIRNVIWSDSLDDEIGHKVSDISQVVNIETAYETHLVIQKLSRIISIQEPK